MERFVLLAGHVADRILFDYGYDLTIRTFDANGEVERDFFYLQFKASDSPVFIDNGKTISVRIEAGDLQAWREERVLVVLIFYDVSADRAYWLHIQELTSNTARTTVRIPITQRFDLEAVEILRQRKNGVR